MFTDLFYLLKKKKVPVSVTEWMTLMETLDKGYITNLDEFYFLARAILVKSEAFYDHYDITFQEYFGGVEGSAGIEDQIFEWLKDPLNRELPFDEMQDSFNKLDFNNLLKEFEERLKEQTEQHDGGGHWIGRGGTSPFGHSGYHPGGIRIGGESGRGQAVQIAQERRFRNYRNDLILDVRQIKMALRGLRQLSRLGLEDELDLEETIKATAKNVGDIELIWRRSRKNAVKVLLLMDVGGSMDPFALLCSTLFSAAHSSAHFKDFQYYYFHNCVYDYLYRDIERNEAINTDYLLQNVKPDYKLIIVGDATMGTWELTERNGAIDYYEQNNIPGIVRLKQISDHFSHRVWLNPIDRRSWIHPAVRLIGELFPMYPLTIDGLGQAVRRLVVKK
ncbi:VWA domain-containing protein [Chloroflexota bacterium]